jgi:hypothetical protein
MDASPEVVRLGLGERGKDDEKERVRETKKEDGKRKRKKEERRPKERTEENQEENRRTEKEKLNHWEFFGPLGGKSNPETPHSTLPAHPT